MACMVCLKLIYAGISLFIYHAFTDLAGGQIPQGTRAPPRMKHLVHWLGVSKHANVRANSSETREMCSRERVADGVVPETSHNRKIYVRPKPGKKEDTSTVCRVAKTTFYYTTQTTSKKHYQRKPFAHPSYYTELHHSCSDTLLFLLFSILKS